MTERASHLKLAVDVGSDPITGSVAVDAGSPTTFCGWIELVQTIEAARSDSDAAQGGVEESTSPEVTLG